MSATKFVISGLATGIFGAAAMYGATSYRQAADTEKAFDSITSDFVTSNLLDQVPGLRPYENDFTKAAKAYLKGNDAVLCSALDRNNCYLALDEETGLLMRIFEEAIDICSKHPKDDAACKKLQIHIETTLDALNSPQA